MSCATSESSNPTTNEARSQSKPIQNQTASESPGQVSGPATDHIKLSKFWCPVRDLSLIQNVPNASELLSHACQGNMLMAKNKDLLRSYGITHILSLTRQRVPEEIRTVFAYKQIQVSDTPRTEIRHTFEGAFEFIEDARKKNGRVLIHCRAGVSRSSCVSIAYLMWHRKMPLKEAYEFVKEKRPIAHPNKGFISQLIAYEKFLFRDAAQGITMNDLAYTIWERTEHLGLNDPLPPMELCQVNEKKVSEEFVRRFGKKNEFMTMDAGLGGKMGLHMVELYSILDFEWMDDIIRNVLRDYNTQARLALMVSEGQPMNMQQQQQQQQQLQQQMQQQVMYGHTPQVLRVGSSSGASSSSKLFTAPSATPNHVVGSGVGRGQAVNASTGLPWPSHNVGKTQMHKANSLHVNPSHSSKGGSTSDPAPARATSSSGGSAAKLPAFQGLGLGLFGSFSGPPSMQPAPLPSVNPGSTAVTSATTTATTSTAPDQQQRSVPQHRHHSTPILPTSMPPQSSASSSLGGATAVRAATASSSTFVGGNIHR